MGTPRVLKAQEILFSNLDKQPIPLALISQYMPEQYTHVRSD